MRRPHRPPELLSGPFTVSMAQAAGLSAKQLRGTAWRQVIRGVYVSGDADDSVALRCAAIKLVLPVDAVVGYTAAAWLHGADVRDRRSLVVEVIGQRGDQIRRIGIRATSALLEPGDVTELCGIPLTTSVRTAFDLARKRDHIEAVVGVDAMLNRGGCSLSDLSDYVAGHRRWRGVRYADAALVQAEPLSESPMETRQRMRLILAGLPRPQAQISVCDDTGRPFAVIDNAYESWRVGADYDGEDHANRWRYDLERQERIRDAGWWHRRYSSLHITAGWSQMVRQVGRALLEAGWRPDARDHAPVDPKDPAVRATSA